MARGGSQNLRRQEGGVTRKPIFAYQGGGGGVKKPENPAYIVYEWSLTRNHVQVTNYVYQQILWIILRICCLGLFSEIPL